MTKDELKNYISEAVDALDTSDLEILFPPDRQPDLYQVAEELVGLKGALNKMSGSTLQLNHEVHQLVEQAAKQHELQEQLIFSLQEPQEPTETEEPSLDADLKRLLLQLLDMDELIQLTKDNFNQLPTLGWLNQNEYKTRFASWQKGFDITLNRWGKLVKSNDLYKTGIVGEVFDPELHEAIAVKHKNDLPDNSILETEQAGFLYKGKVIRLAKVVVNKVKIVKVVEPFAIEKEVISLPPKEPIVDSSPVEEVELEPGNIQREPKSKRKKGNRRQIIKNRKNKKKRKKRRK